MKKIVLTLSFVLFITMLQSYRSHQKTSLANLDLQQINYNKGIETDTLPKKQHKAVAKKETSKTPYGVDKSSTVTGEAGSGSGVGSGGSKSAADTMKIMK